MINILYVIAVIGFLALVGMVLWLLYTIFRHKYEPQDASIILNFLSHLDNGYFLGVETDQSFGKKGRHFIKMIPRDIDAKTNPADVKEISIIAGRNKLLPLPKGSLSKRRSVTIILPKDASDYHEAVKNTEFGKIMMLGTEMINAANAEIGSLLEGHNRKDKIIEKIGHGEVSKEFLTFQEELYRDALRYSLDAKTKDKSSSSSSSIIPKKE